MTTQTLARTPPKPSAARRTGRGALAVLRPLRGLAPLAVLLLLWQLLGNRNSPYFPVPSQWASALVHDAESGVLGDAVVLTVVSFLVALVLAVVIGGVIGVAVGSSQRADAAFNPLIQFLRAIPAAAIVPAATLLLGTGDATAVAIVVFTSVWPVIIATRSAVHALNPLLLDVSATLHLSRGARLRKLLLPSLISPVLLGARVTAPIALLITLLVELLTGTTGIGGLLATAQQQFLSATAYGYVVIAAVLSLLVNAGLHGIDAWAKRYAPRTTDH
ncbi:ABC transporter permease [Streptomyces sp. NPDC050560]|uniref:ABC transporter permease n=1 Tax=Streptomyces sp. NPDC050560 TaxID=3365630 RepID=UPI0037A80669